MYNFVFGFFKNNNNNYDIELSDFNKETSNFYYSSYEDRKGVAVNILEEMDNIFTLKTKHNLSTEEIEILMNKFYKNIKSSNFISKAEFSKISNRKRIY